MEIIPKSMFFILNDIIELQTHKIKELPTRLEKVELKDFAQLDERNQLAKLTHGVSKFTEGILAMQTTLVGIIKVEPKQLLEEGIRKELVYKLASAMDKILIFKTGKIDEFESRLKQLASQLGGFSRPFPCTPPPRFPTPFAAMGGRHRRLARRDQRRQDDAFRHRARCRRQVHGPTLGSYCLYLPGLPVR
jgi:hypothetical protein